LEDLDDVTGDECDDLMALMDALEIEPDHFVDWMNSVQARIPSAAEIEANVLKMHQLDELLSSKIQGVYTGMFYQNG
jgi:hypothetical protein